ncbi:hypothetical protein BRD15_09710 [Halobacteriales archaeon SW_6_65_15]|jgi:hypothetical protein|nr:MAG: hypothetical protein BRD15_09710 [Halobacteriales archaeon SW_6_65_15]
MADRGRADPVAVETTVERDEVEYLPEEDAVRYVAAWMHADHEAFVDGTNTEREPRYETTPFEQWAPTECARVGAERVLEVARDRLERGREEVRYGVSAEDGAETIHVEYSTVLGRDGTTVSEPTVDHDELVAATPASVTVTISFDGRTHTETIPVWVQHSTERLE